MKILVTGFDPFGGEPINPALEAVKRLPDTIEGAEIKWVEIPTVFYKSADVLEKNITDFEPDAVLCIGQAGGRFGLTPERVAINQDDARIPDNEGKQPIDLPIREDGEPAYFTKLPIKAMVEAIKAEGLPASVSNTAGTFVCNHLMYQLLYLVDKKFPNIKRAGFMHIPFMTEQVVDKPGTASMNLDDISRGIKAAVSAIVKHYDQDDLNIVGGATH
ncbi:pyrrolidone-carboxylate peptidase [Streptococcus urinalis FB127-CNA-2]|uniref:Pyrrolidone-carboxylate peptidase n=1 Tax=Streptococcus urinalis 2285-97 TaxID=764291 RepID=G5KCA3_9STRE|nr:pyroglutamyl-peptidase I [Streptococcus urinalis]EHJ57686.1 pyroglutamyl-peptidase I [Streptococcus urinalis 2285-97]EKS19733.1 pyrrolidone-carboxylate peptidase [Streptococcus urinalis FB127-CNA-2]VEF31310.1 pyroglutamyl-peptidase I [Streptococcus urinalis]